MLLFSKSVTMSCKLYLLWLTHKDCFNTMVMQSVPAELHGQGSVAFSPAFVWLQVMPANNSVSQVWSTGKTKIFCPTFYKELAMCK